MKFSLALDQFGIKVLANTDKVRRASILELFQLVVMSTPVDTGRLRGNWQASVNTPILTETARKDPAGSAVVAEVLANMGGLPDAVYFTNNLPYAEAIEYGHSKQAPEGMVRKNVARWPDIVRAKAKHFGRGAA